MYIASTNLGPCMLQDKLIEKIKSTLGEFYPEGPAKSDDYPRLVNDRHFQYVLGKSLFWGILMWT